MVWLKRSFGIAVLFLANCTAVFIWFGVELLINNSGFYTGPGRGDGVPTIPAKDAFFLVAGMFLLDVFVLWLLSKIGGPLKAEVKASIKKFGGSLWITGAGLLGAFMAVSLLGFGAIYVFSH
jgi:hypothetical protein